MVGHWGNISSSGVREIVPRGPSTHLALQNFDIDVPYKDSPSIPIYLRLSLWCIFRLLDPTILLVLLCVISWDRAGGFNVCSFYIHSRILVVLVVAIICGSLRGAGRLRRFRSVLLLQRIVILVVLALIVVRYLSLPCSFSTLLILLLGLAPLDFVSFSSPSRSFFLPSLSFHRSIGVEGFGGLFSEGRDLF